MTDYHLDYNEPISCAVISGVGEVLVTEETQTVSDAGTLAAAASGESIELGAQNVTDYFMPAATSQIVLDDLETMVISCSTSRSLSDKMATASFQFDKTSISAIPTSYFTHVVLHMTDYLGNDNVVFCGFFPSSTSKYQAANFKDSFTAVDYGFYLTKQYLSDDLLALMTPDFQTSYQKQMLQYHFCDDPLLNFAKGQRVFGATTGDSGKILENHFSGYNGLGYLILVDMIGVTHTVEPYFHDDENLEVNGVVIAAADGYTMNVTGTVDVIYPEDWIRSVLGGDDWQKLTGIEPYRITPVAAWDVALPAVEFIFETTQTKMSAIEEIAEYCSYIFLVKWRDIGGGIYRPCAYFVPEADIDEADGLDLPAAAAITSPNATLVDITLDRRGDERYNKVTVRCQDIDGVWYESVKQSDGVISGDEIPIEYYEENPNITTQADCDARADDIYDYYSSHVETWTVNLLKRSDLQLLQKVVFTGYATSYQLPNGNYRIIDISHSQSPGSSTTTIKVVSDADFTAHLRLNRVFTGPIATMQAVAKEAVNKIAKNKAGTVLAVDGNTITFLDERGNVQIVRDAS